MLIAIRGTDSFLAGETIRQIKDRYRAKHGPTGDLVEFDGSTPPNGWVDLGATSLFTSSRLVIVTRAHELEADSRQALAQALDRLPTSTVAVIWDALASKKPDPLELRLNQADKTIAAAPLAPIRLKSWLTLQAKQQGLTVTPEGLEALIAEHGSDLWALSTALKTVGAAGVGASKKTTTDEPFIHFSLIRRGDWARLRQQLRQDYQAGKPIELILGTLAAAVRKLPLTAKSPRRALAGYLAELDFGLKTGVLDSASVFALLVAHLPQPSRTNVQWQKVWEETVS
jgi:DNA polymerase III delta subunit